MEEVVRRRRCNHDQEGNNGHARDERDEERSEFYEDAIRFLIVGSALAVCFIAGIVAYIRKV